MHPLLTRELLSEKIRTSQMTCWFNLNMLAGTLRDIAVSSLIGDRFDCRRVIAGRSSSAFVSERRASCPRPASCCVRTSSSAS